MLQELAWSMVARGVVSLPLEDEALEGSPWKHMEDRVREAARAEWGRADAKKAPGSPHLLTADQLADLRVGELRNTLRSCPLQVRGSSLTFAHKSLRDYYAAMRFCRFPDDGRALITRDPAILSFAAEFVECGPVIAWRQKSGGRKEELPAAHCESVAIDENSSSFSLRALRVLMTSSAGSVEVSAAVAAANCISVLVAGCVSLSGLDLRGVRIDHPDIKPSRWQDCAMLWYSFRCLHLQSWCLSLYALAHIRCAASR
jgi:hypothetical protein